MNRPKRRIETVHVGNASAKIYRRTRTIGRHQYPTFEVCDYTGGRRRLRSFADHQAAVREAERLARQLATGDAMAAFMSGREAASFDRCLELLQAAGDPPELACARYAEAVGVGNMLSPAARLYVDRRPLAHGLRALGRPKTGAPCSCPHAGHFQGNPERRRNRSGNS